MMVALGPKSRVKRYPRQIRKPRRFFLERTYPIFGNLAPRASRRAPPEDATMAGVRDPDWRLLEFADASAPLNHVIRYRYGNLFVNERIRMKSVRGSDSHLARRSYTMGDSGSITIS